MSNLDEVLHSAQQMVNEHRHAYPPVWHDDATRIIEQARAELAALRAVVEAARKLQVKMLRVYNTPEYQTVWSIAQSHVGKYEGGNWIDEFDELAAELARVDGEK